MRQVLALVIVAALLVLSPLSARAGKYPEPSIYPVSWQLGFKHSMPKRLVVGNDAYWYMTYTVTNKTGMEQMWRLSSKWSITRGKSSKPGTTSILRRLRKSKLSSATDFSFLQIR